MFILFFTEFVKRSKNRAAQVFSELSTGWNGAFRGILAVASSRGRISSVPNYLAKSQVKKGSKMAKKLKVPRVAPFSAILFSSSLIIAVKSSATPIRPESR